MAGRFSPCLFRQPLMELDKNGELAQLARASALQAEGQGFKPPILQEGDMADMPLCSTDDL